MRRTVALAVCAVVLVAGAALAQPVAFVGFDLAPTDNATTSGSAICSAELAAIAAHHRTIAAQCERPCATSSDCAVTGVTGSCLAGWGYCTGNSVQTQCTEDSVCTSTPNRDCALPYVPEVGSAAPSLGTNRYALRLRAPDARQQRNSHFTTSFNGGAVASGAACVDWQYRGYCANNPSLPCTQSGLTGCGQCRVMKGEATIGQLLAPNGDPQLTLTLGCSDGTSACELEPLETQPQGGRRLRLYYGDPLQRSCSESFVDGSLCDGVCQEPLDDFCTPDTGECVAENDGAPKCGFVAYARSAPLEFGQWYRVCVEWSYTDRRVEGALHVGEIGAADTESRVAEQGRRSIPQGACVGGANAGNACQNNADCPSSTCGDPPGRTVAAPDRFRYGVIDWTEYEGVLHARIDNVFACNSAGDSRCVDRGRRQRFLSLFTNGEDGSDQCADQNNTAGRASCGAGGTGHWGCVSDPGDSVCDGQGSYVSCATGDTNTWTLTNLPGSGLTNCATDDTVPCIAADALVGVNCAVRVNATITDPRPIRLSLKVSSNVDGGTVTNLTDEPAGNAAYDADYVAIKPHLTTVAPGGGAWSMSALDGLSMRIANETTGTGTPRRVRFSSCAAVATYEIPPPPSARVLVDRNGDDLVRVCLYGDSTMNGQTVQDTVRARLLGRVDAIIEAAEGRRQCGDFLLRASQIASGTASGEPVTSKAILGNPGPCDYILGTCGYNDGLWNYGTTGTCSTGGTCTVPLGSSGPLYQDSTSAPQRICTSGPHVGEPCNRICAATGQRCNVNGDCSSGTCDEVGCVAGACTTSALSHVSCFGRNDCTKALCGRCSNNHARYCNTNAQCTGGGTCDNAIGARDVADMAVNNRCWFKPAWDVPSCPGGWCGETTKQAYYRSTWRQMAAIFDARSGAQTVKQGWMLPFDSHGCFEYGWGCSLEQYRSLRNWGRAWASERGYAWIDFHREFFDTTPGGRVTAALQDFVHPSITYQAIMGDLIADCLSGVPGNHDCTPFYTACVDDTDCAAQIDTECRTWPGTADKYCLGSE